MVGRDKTLLHWFLQRLLYSGQQPPRILETQKKKKKPQKSFLLSYKRNSDTFAFIEKEKALASIEKQRSISALTEKPQKETPRQHTRETAYRRRRKSSNESSSLIVKTKKTNPKKAPMKTPMKAPLDVEHRKC
jgi:hypothetical protein